MSSNNNSSGAGIGFLGLLTIAFIVLKLTKCIAWSWWWVLAPMWMSLALVLLVVQVVDLLQMEGETMKWYISGKISGLPTDQVTAKFKQAEQ